MPTTANTFAQAKATGVAQCGLCAGEAAAKLHNAGCTDAEISNWCSGSTASANANANAKANANANANANVRLLCLFGVRDTSPVGTIDLQQTA